MKVHIYYSYYYLDSCATFVKKIVFSNTYKHFKYIIRPVKIRISLLVKNIQRRQLILGTPADIHFSR